MWATALSASLNGMTQAGKRFHSGFGAKRGAGNGEDRDLLDRRPGGAPAKKALTAVGLVGLALAVSGCSALGIGKPAFTGDIKPGTGAYSVYYTDMINDLGNASTVEADGALVATANLRATNLSTRIDSPSTVGMLGHRSADLVFVNNDGSVDTGYLDYPEGTGSTAAAWLETDEIASLINVGQSEQGYVNPLVVHDRTGKTLRSLKLQGYLNSAIVQGDELYVAGEIGPYDPEDEGSRIFVVDPKNMTVLDQHDWVGTGGIKSCAMASGMLYCLESDSFNNVDYPEFAWNKLVRIDPRTWEKTLIREFTDMGIRVENIGDRIYVLLEHRLALLSTDGTTIAAEREFGNGEEAKIERLEAGPEGKLDLFIRDFSFAERSGGRDYIGDIHRLAPSTLKTTRSTPMELPGEQFVDVHALAAEFLTRAK